MAQSKETLLFWSKFAWLPVLVIAVVVLYANGVSWQTFVENDHPASVFIFILLMALLPALGVPITPFYLFAGAVHSFPKALLICGVSLSLNMVISYVIAYTPLAKAIRSRLNQQTWIRSLIDKNNHLELTLILRIVPGIPYTLQNYALALAGVPFLMYLVLSMLIQSLYMAAWLYLGNSGAKADPPMISLALLILLVLFLGTRYLFKRLVKNRAAGP